MFNLKSTIYQTEWLDLVFADRNKAYGAYELRQNYNRRLFRALFIASFGVTLLFSYPFVKRYFEKGDAIDPIFQDNKIIQVSLPPPIQEVEPPAPAPAAATPQPESVQLETIDHRVPVVVSTPVATDPPTVDDLQTAVISDHDTQGQPTTSNASPVETGTGNGTGAGPIDGGNSNEIMDVSVLEKYPEFPGGMEAFAKYLRKNLRYPDRAIEAGVGGKVFVSFVVEKDGRLTDIKVLRGIGYGCDEEATRVLKKSPAWNPGIQNTRPVRVLYTIPLHFQFDQ